LIAKIPIKLNVNGHDYVVEVRPHWTLNHVLRNEMGLKGTKQSCGTGECGACTVVFNGKAVCSCIFPVMKADCGKIVTIEGLSSGGKLHPLQEAFVEHGAFQCGFCTPGVIMKAKAFLDGNPAPTELDVKEALVGNICRCTGLVKPIKAVLAAAEKMSKKE